MEKASFSNWQSGLAINLVSNVIGVIAGVVVTYFSHAGSGWVKPLLFGGLAWLLTFCSILAWRVMRNLPPRLELTTSENVAAKVRGWLDKYGLAVQTIREPGTEFFFIVTTDGQKKISISRTTGHLSDSIVVKALWSAGDEEKEMLNKLSESEQTSLRLAIRLELARAVMGFNSENIFNITLFKRVPISSSLGEADLLNAVWEVEATLSAVFLVGGIALNRHAINKEQELHVKAESDEGREH